MDLPPLPPAAPPARDGDNGGGGILIRTLRRGNQVDYLFPGDVAILHYEGFVLQDDETLRLFDSSSERLPVRVCYSGSEVAATRDPNDSTLRRRRRHANKDLNSANESNESPHFYSVWTILLMLWSVLVVNPVLTVMTCLSRWWRQQFGAWPPQVIRGWEVALSRLSVGQCVQVTIPSLYAYGAVGCPPSIPPHATLVYRLELVDIVEDNPWGVSW
jgi:FKBP-type peptidyl-prolyl cis-trans isomerase